ncbi:hypothetical protein HS7_19780 [Sulfolobales archaeon HS-7]|nr:hypothetical protein HS7_19780 [Sulfolobales archaeon HS-7]
MPGSGKTLVAKTFRAEGFYVISMGDILRQDFEKNKMPNESLMEYAIRIRKEKGDEIIAKLTSIEIEKVNQMKVLIDGVRSMKEVNVFQQAGSVEIIAVHSPPRLRYQRILQRAREDDTLSEIWLRERDLAELSLGIGEVIALADYMILNDSDMETLKQNVLRLVMALKSD